MSTNSDNLRRIGAFLTSTIDMSEAELADLVELLEERFPGRLTHSDCPPPAPRPSRKPVFPSRDMVEAWQAVEAGHVELSVPQTDEPETTFYAVGLPDGSVFPMAESPEAAVRAFAAPMLEDLADPAAAAEAFGAPPSSVAELVALPKGAAILQVRGPAAHVQAFDRAL